MTNENDQAAQVAHGITATPSPFGGYNLTCKFCADRPFVNIRSMDYAEEQAEEHRRLRH